MSKLGMTSKFKQDIEIEPIIASLQTCFKMLFANCLSDS